MRLIKLHGLGNDYLVVERAETALSPEMVVALCDRNTGVGADGVLEPIESQTADFGVVIHNPDGSQAEKSGNGLRILSRYLVDYRSASLEHTVETPAGVVRCRVEGSEIEVQMGTATVDPAQIPAAAHVLGFDFDGVTTEAIAVGMGNPHCVVFLGADLDSVDWRTMGAALEVDARFPNRTNVQFVRLLEAGRTDTQDPVIEARIWERGAGETSSSGSSASAVAVAAVTSGRCSPGRFSVVMPGGTLRVSVTGTLDVCIRGPVQEVCVVDVSDSWIAEICMDSQGLRR